MNNSHVMSDKGGERFLLGDRRFLEALIRGNFIVENGGSEGYLGVD